MKAFIKKNKLTREEYKKSELNYYINSALNKNSLLDPVTLKRLKFNFSCKATSQLTAKLQSNNGTSCGTAIIQPNSAVAISKLRNICVITGRARAINLDYKMSRIQFKQNAEAGLIPGIKKL